MDKIHYPKYYSNPKQLVEILKSRGLSIENEAKAESYLINIGYFRLSAYFYPLLQIPKTEHTYKVGSSFSQVLNIYRFDKKLRLLIFNEIEKIEVAIRSIVINTGCEYYGDIFWMTNRSNFINISYFDKFKNDLSIDLSKSSEDFITHFVSTYDNDFPPAWCIAEIISLGNICHIFKNIKDQSLKKKIAAQFGLHHSVFESWIMTLAGLRNICCHHGRLWNRMMKLKPVIPYVTIKPWLLDTEIVDIQRIYYRLCIIEYLLFSISPNNSFKIRLLNLLKQYPNVDILAMGFTPQWQNEPLWK